MALKLILPFPIFSPPCLNPNPNPNSNPTFLPLRHLIPSELRFSRWSNANAEEFELRRHTQEEIESDIRRQRRFSSADRISQIRTSFTATTTTNTTVKSTGTPSSPSSPSIPGKRSKYSISPFKSISRVKKTQKKNLVVPKTDPIDKKAELKLSEDGVSYVIEGAPFEFMYSYTETPKAKPLKLREPPYAPFGPTTTPRPWTGRAPLPPSKKKSKEFDSFKLPPPGKKGVKPVQAPGPYLPGTGPRYVRTSEEILGEPLTPEEVKDLVNGCIKSRRQLNMGRDGLTHNMLDNIHAHWKRRRVCKIKCKGVCTVDMDNVKKQLEERTRGKIIHSRGGVIFLFRGRNYNYKTRPRFPLMLWKPVSPLYPRLIQRVPEGLTLEEATEMRKKGRTLMPICKLAKNGNYCDLVANVREAFEECELVRIDCQGLNPSDYKRIGGKLKDLVPCVLISFENECILMWRGCEWKSSLPDADKPNEKDNSSAIDDVVTSAPSSQGLEVSFLTGIDKGTNHKAFAENVSPFIPESADPKVSEHINSENIVNEVVDVDFDVEKTVENEDEGRGIENIKLDDVRNKHVPIAVSDKNGFAVDNHKVQYACSMVNITCNASELVGIEGFDKMLDTVEILEDQSEVETLPSPCTEGVLLLLKQAVENGSALVLDSSLLDADLVYQKAVAFAKASPPGPIFRRRPRRIVQRKIEKEDGNLDVKEAVPALENKKNEKRNPKIQRKRDLDEQGYLNVSAHGSLRVDELAKLLA